MSNILILSPHAVASIAATSQNPSFPAAQLLDAQPRVIWRASAPLAVVIDIDLGKDQSVDTVFLGFTNASASSVWVINMASEAEGTAYFSNSASIAKDATFLAAEANSGVERPHAFWTGPARTARHIRLTLSGGGQIFEAGVVMVGRAFVPRYNIEWGAGRGVTDLSQINTLRGGTADVLQDAIIPTYRFTLGDLEDAEVRALWKTIKAHGRSKPLLVVENPGLSEGLQEAIHYGALRDIAEYERLNPLKSRWEFTIQQWV